MVYLNSSFILSLGNPRTGAEEPHLSVELEGACKVVLQGHGAPCGGKRARKITNSHCFHEIIQYITVTTELDSIVVVQFNDAI